MGGVRRLEHVGLSVVELDSAVEFYTDVLGLVELDRSDGTIYLGCGLDGNFDLAVSEGGTGVDHFAVRVDQSGLERRLERLEEASVDVTRTDGAEPGQRAGARFDLPSGNLSMELVTVDDVRYQNAADVEGLPTAAPVHPDRSSVAPIDLSHVTVMTPALRTDVEFLRDVLDFRVSDVGVTPGDEWEMVFVRTGDYHHDVALFDDPEDTLHHVAWEMRDMNHIRDLSDVLAASGHGLEVGPVRHGPGSNVAAYFREPGGNRFEMTADVETVGPDAEMRTHRVDEVPFCVWSDRTPPESFRDGS